MKTQLKKGIAGAAAVAVLAAGGVAAVGIGSDVALAQEDGIEADETRQFTTFADALSELVDDGVISQEQADAVEAKLSEVHEARRGPWRGFARGLSGFDVLEDLDLDPAEVREQLQDGATLAEIIEAAGGDVDAVIDAAVAAATDRIQAAVDSGRLEQAEADEKIAELETQITERLTSDLSDVADRGFGRRGGFRGPGAEAPGVGTATDA